MLVDTVDADELAINKELADVLNLLGNYFALVPDVFRAKAFKEAGRAVGQYTQPIISGKQARAALPGVGKSSAEVIDEYLEKGEVTRLKELEKNLTDARKVIDLFRSYYGIGPVTAIKFYNIGWRTLEDLWYKAPLNEAQKIGILWRFHLELPIPRSEMDLIATAIHRILDPYAITWEIAGSYRRQEPQSGDIDLLIQSRSDLNMAGIMHLLQPILAATLAAGETKYMGILRLSNEFNGHRLDIRLIPPPTWPFALMYFTGSQRFNILMRQRAIEFKLKLNEYGLFNSANQSLPATSEADIFALLHIAYLDPSQRTRDLQHLTPIP